jgi:hypothetical protein
MGCSRSISSADSRSAAKARTNAINDSGSDTILSISSVGTGGPHAAGSLPNQCRIISSHHASSTLITAMDASNMLTLKRNFMALFYPTGGSVWRRDFRRRMYQRAVSVAAMASGIAQANRLPNSRKLGLCSRITSLNPSPVQVFVCGTLIVALRTQTTATAVTQTSSVASEN